MAVACLLFLGGMAGWERLVREDGTGVSSYYDDISAVFYALAIALFGTIGVPPALMFVPVGAVWPAALAFVICFVGGVCGAVLGFLGSRHFAQHVLENKIPPRVRAFEERLETHGFGTVITLRLLFFLFPPVNWLLGISHIPLGTFVVATIIGALPGTIIFTVTGSGVIPWLMEHSLATLLAICGIALLVAGGWGCLLLRSSNGAES